MTSKWKYTLLVAPIIIILIRLANSAWGSGLHLDETITAWITAGGRTTD